MLRHKILPFRINGGTKVNRKLDEIVVILGPRNMDVKSIKLLMRRQLSCNTLELMVHGLSCGKRDPDILSLLIPIR